MIYLFRNLGAPFYFSLCLGKSQGIERRRHLDFLLLNVFVFI